MIKISRINKILYNFEKIKDTFDVPKTIDDYMLKNKYINADQDKEIKLYYQNKNARHEINTMHYELKAHEKGFIDEESLIKIITEFRQKTVITQKEIDNMYFTFANLNRDFVIKNYIIEIRNYNRNDDSHHFLCSFKIENRVLFQIQGKFENVKFYHTLPKYMDDIIEQIKEDMEEEEKKKGKATK